MLEYSDNYADSSGSLWQFKRDKHNTNNARSPADANQIYKSKYKSNLLGKPANKGVLGNVKIAVPLKYLSNFFRSLEVPLINCKICLELSWSKDCVMLIIADTNFQKQAQNCMFQLLLFELMIM